MQILNICIDCFGNDISALNEVVDEIKNKNEVHVFKSHCMGVCPRNKISTIYLKDNQVNEFNITSLTVKELKRF